MRFKHGEALVISDINKHLDGEYVIVKKGERMSEEQKAVERVLDKINDAQKEITLIRRNLKDSVVMTTLKKYDSTNKAFGFLNSARHCFGDWKEAQ